MSMTVLTELLKLRMPWVTKPLIPTTVQEGLQSQPMQKEIHRKGLMMRTEIL